MDPSFFNMNLPQGMPNIDFQNIKIPPANYSVIVIIIVIIMILIILGIFSAIGIYLYASNTTEKKKEPEK